LRQGSSIHSAHRQATNYFSTNHAFGKDGFWTTFDWQHSAEIGTKENATPLQQLDFSNPLEINLLTQDTFNYEENKRIFLERRGNVMKITIEYCTE